MFSSFNKAYYNLPNENKTFFFVKLKNYYLKFLKFLISKPKNKIKCFLDFYVIESIIFFIIIKKTKNNFKYSNNSIHNYNLLKSDLFYKDFLFLFLFFLIFVVIIIIIINMRIITENIFNRYNIASIILKIVSYYAWSIVGNRLRLVKNRLRLIKFCFLLLIIK